MLLLRTILFVKTSLVVCISLMIVFLCFLLATLVQMLHNASLLLDDIEDNSVLRRGNPVAHKVYGIPSTLNSANYVMFIGLERVLDLGHPQAVHIFSQQMLELHRGQGMEIYWRDNYLCPTEDEYRKMTIRKTGKFISLICLT